MPGEKSSGAGALPGTSEETGVAVLPDEKSESSDESLQIKLMLVEPPVSDRSQVNQGMLPGEMSGFGAFAGGTMESEERGMLG